MTPPTPPGPEPLGPLLARLRLARGRSQQLLAAELCAASGVPTLSRHEVSRWERQLRVPGDFWLGWLAVTLAVPVELLAEAAEHSRPARRGTPAAGPARPRAGGTATRRPRLRGGPSPARPVPPSDRHHHPTGAATRPAPPPDRRRHPASATTRPAPPPDRRHHPASATTRPASPPGGPAITARDQALTPARRRSAAGVAYGAPWATDATRSRATR